jgi:hypothetical protein
MYAAAVRVPVPAWLVPRLRCWRPVRRPASLAGESGLVPVAWRSVIPVVRQGVLFPFPWREIADEK